ncbi:MAG: D-alanyl-D-alanine carboxypeptidase [Firmicutes bacterium]|nr:D-alanyl-D-alanine carboxypeptidase [Bacillota bacterium]
MMHRWGRALVAIWSFAIMVGWVSPVRAAQVSEPVVTAKAAELIDGLSGQVLFQKNAAEELPMASVTKLMTLYLAIRAINRKQIGLEDLVPVSEEAYRVNGSQIWLEPGERLTVDQLLKGIAIGSANDAAYALGEYIAGSNEAFVDEMNRTARALGMSHTHFANPHGLHQVGHYTTAHDLGILALHAVRMPLLLHYTAMWEDRTLRNGKGGHLWLINHNRLLRQYPGMDGLKTGYTSQAGFCIVATAKRGPTRMIAVILGAPSSKIRFHDASTLLTWGFQHFETRAVAHRGDVAGVVGVTRGSQRSVKAIFAADGYLTEARAERATLQKELQLPKTVVAPVRRGQVLGHLVIRRDGRVVLSIPVVADTSVSRASWLGRAWRAVWRIAG